MERTKGRVAIGKNPKENLDAALEIIKKHRELGNESPLKVLEDVDWAALSPKVDAALTAHDRAEYHKGEMEKEYRARDSAMPEIQKVVQRSVSLLKASFGGNPKKLADWGLEVDDTPQARKKKDGDH